MRNLNNELKNRTINYDRLISYGFIKMSELYEFKTKIKDNQFEMFINILNGEITSKLIDLANDEEYVLVDIEGVTGEFVGSVREEYESKIKDFIEQCTISDVFKCQQSKKVIEYIKEKYGDELEFLWEKFDDNAIWRNNQNNKWYGLLMKIQRSKLGIDSEEIIEAMDLRYQKDRVDEVIDNKSIYPGYHMNKKSWITLILDGSLDIKTIYELIDNSYQLSIGNKCGLVGDDLVQKVYDYLTLIPKGKVVTYKQVAEYIGNKGLARVVGNILHKNPDGDKYPCYKVVNSKGELADAFAFGGKDIQKERLEKDGIEVIENKVDLKVYQWKEE